MTTPTTAEDWGRLAVSLPGAPELWGWASKGLGIVYVDGSEGFYGVASDGTWWEPTGRSDRPWVLVVDHPATAGCLLALLGPFVTVTRSRAGGFIVHVAGDEVPLFGEGTSIGRAAIATAAALGRWPGGGA